MASPLCSESRLAPKLYKEGKRVSIYTRALSKCTTVLRDQAPTQHAGQSFTTHRPSGNASIKIKLGLGSPTVYRVVSKPRQQPEPLVLWKKQKQLIIKHCCSPVPAAAQTDRALCYTI